MRQARLVLATMAVSLCIACVDNRGLEVRHFRGIDEAVGPPGIGGTAETSPTTAGTSGQPGGAAAGLAVSEVAPLGGSASQGGHASANGGANSTGEDRPLGGASGEASTTTASGGTQAPGGNAGSVDIRTTALGGQSRTSASSSIGGNFGLSGGARAPNPTTATGDAGMGGAGGDAQPDASPPGSGLLLYYPFENLNGTAVPDESGNKNDGTLRSDAVNAGAVSNGSHQLAPGKVGQGLTLIGNGSGYISIPPALFRGLTEITIATWFKIVTVVNWQRLIDVGVDSHSYYNPGNGSKYMHLAPEDRTTNMVFGISKDGVDHERRIITPGPAAGVWTHVAVVLASDGSGKLYVNGALAASDSSIRLNPSDLGPIDYAYIGKSPFSNDPYLDAVIDEFRVYGRALSASEVLALFQFTGP
jgi:hypothetical protein